MENFKEWGYSAKDETYLTAILATWFSGRIFGDSSTAIRSEAIFMAVMTQDKWYSLAVPSGMGLTIVKVIQGDVWEICKDLWALSSSVRLVGLLILPDS